VIPNHLIWVPIQDVQVDRASSPRRVLFAFQGSDTAPGTIGIYTGP